MQTYNPLIAYHSRKDNTGWREECRHPADWDGWHPFDKGIRHCQRLCHLM